MPCTEDSRRRLVRHAHGPERQILSGIGPVGVWRAKVRDRGAWRSCRAHPLHLGYPAGVRPRRRWALDAVPPVLYLRGISTGEFQEALSTLLGRDAPALSVQELARLEDRL